MSVGVQVVILRDDVTPALQAKLAQLQPRALAAEVGEALTITTQNHLRANGTNKRGWRSTGFWASAAKSTSWAATDDGVVISINKQGVRQRVFGGRISAPGKTANATGAQWLTIPITPEAYGKTSKDFAPTFIVKTPKGAYVCTTSGGGGKFYLQKNKDGSTSRTKGATAIKFLFKLVKSVNQKADPSVIPHFMTYRQVLFNQLEKIVARQPGGVN